MLLKMVKIRERKETSGGFLCEFLLFKRCSGNAGFGGENIKSDQRAAEIMEKLKHAGYTIFVVEHRFYYLRDLIDRAFLIQNGKIEHESQGNSFALCPKKHEFLMACEQHTQNAMQNIIRKGRTQRARHISWKFTI